MLAGTVYFYDDEEELIKEIDVEEYDRLSEDAFAQMLRDSRGKKIKIESIKDVENFEE